jgi:hypothetical protein
MRAPRTPQIVLLLAAPGRVFADHVARAADVPPRWSDVLAALSVPTAIVGASVAFGYAGALLATHFVGNMLLLGASFAIQSFAAALVGRVLYGRGARVTLVPFALTLVAQEALFVGAAVSSIVLPWKAGIIVGALLGVACLSWNVVLDYALFRALDRAPEGAGARRARAVLAVVLHVATIAVLVGLYAHAQDLLPYPAGRP